ncbi:helix-turn-helix domain-containing protein [Nonomuraea rhizosphaerae]|uniref:helix-turn-helix domain-containing protein n=1 Tax=Nonomuraea rhizosphaerae TaxID=2665663 RepID=UPI001C5F87F0|nr:helix-turn-helix transcriptional regulator [Nonomuraea rhizosphaerae]
MTTPNPTLRQRQLAARLRDLRHQAGLNIADVAERLLCSPAKISRIETAQRRVSLRDVRDLCNLYNADPSPLMALAKDAQQREWWQEYDDPEFRDMIGLEVEASAIVEYETTTVPGLLQTEDYARAMIRGWLPRIAGDILDDRVAARMKRQDLLHRLDPPRYWVLLDESALWRHVGGVQTMHEQLDHLARMAELPQITIQVIPFTVGAHMGFDSAFRHLAFDNKSGIADTVFVEHQMGHFYLEGYRVDRFKEIIDYLRAMAESPQDSRKRITDMATKFHP